MAAATITLLTAILEGSHSARSSLLASIPALELLARCALHPTPAVRAALRDLFYGLLFDAPAAVSAAGAIDPVHLPHFAQPAARPVDAPYSAWECITSLPVDVLEAFALPEAMHSRAEHVTVDTRLQGLTPEDWVWLAARRHGHQGAH